MATEAEAEAGYISNFQRHYGALFGLAFVQKKEDEAFWKEAAGSVETAEGQHFLPHTTNSAPVDNPPCGQYANCASVTVVIPGNAVLISVEWGVYDNPAGGSWFRWDDGYSVQFVGDKQVISKGAKNWSTGYDRKLYIRAHFTRPAIN